MAAGDGMFATAGGKKEGTYLLLAFLAAFSRANGQSLWT